MPKCPNCGSTAQVKSAYTWTYTDLIVKGFKCGCGCHFQQNFKLLDTVKIIQKST